jgi:Helix-turn-helix domain of resolvase
MERRTINPALLKPVAKKNTRVKDSKALKDMPDDSELVFGANVVDTVKATRTTDKQAEKAHSESVRSSAGYTTGRPTKYDPTYCDEVIEWGKQGFSKTHICTLLGITRETLYNWTQTYTEFFDAINKAMHHSQVWWEQRAMWGITQPASQFNTGLFNKMVSCRFPHDYRETTRTEVGGIEGGVPIPVAVASTQVTGENLADFYKQLVDRNRGSAV